jgi:hypothetical protein
MGPGNRNGKPKQKMKMLSLLQLFQAEDRLFGKIVLIIISLLT